MVQHKIISNENEMSIFAVYYKSTRNVFDYNKSKDNNNNNNNKRYY